MGESALKRAWGGDSRTITDAKRFMGLKFNSKPVQDLISGHSKKWPFDIAEDANGKPVFKLRAKNLEGAVE